MKYIKFLLISILISNSLLANVLPSFAINELYFDSEDNWYIELWCVIPEEKFEGYYLKSKSDTSSFLSGLEFDSAGLLLFDNSSMTEPVYIDKNEDRLAVAGAKLYFGPGEKYKAPEVEQSLCRDYPGLGEYYLDNSPSLGFRNDTLDACCTFYGYVKDSLGNTIDSTKLCLNKYFEGVIYPRCRDLSYTDTDGYFGLRSRAYACLSTLELTKDRFDTTKIEILDLCPDSTYDLGTITLKTNLDALPEDQPEFNRFSLYQNYPNPFIRETKIAFTLPETLPTLLEVYNPEGQKVKTLVKGTISKGKHEVTFDAAELSSGVYIYKLRAGRHYSTSKKFIITK
jgi:hypothetical protein